MVRVKHFYIVHETNGKRFIEFYGEAVAESKKGKVVSEVFVVNISIEKMIFTQKVEYFF